MGLHGFFHLLSCEEEKVRSFLFDLMYTIACIGYDYVIVCEVMRRRRTIRERKIEHGKEKKRNGKRRAKEFMD